jgi:hypothetical protein
MKPFRSQCLTLLCGVLELRIDWDEAPEVFPSKAVAIKALAYLAPESEQYVAFVGKMLRSPLVGVQISACDSLVIAVRHGASIDLAAVLSMLMEELAQQISTDGAAAMLTAIAVVLYHCEPDTAALTAEGLHGIFTTALDGNLVCMQQPNQRTQADLCVLPIVFSLFVFAVRTLGAQMVPYVDAYQARFTKILLGKNRHANGHVFVRMAALGIAAGSADLVQLAAINAVQAINTAHVLVRASAFNAVSLVIKANPVIVTEHQDAVRETVGLVLAVRLGVENLTVHRLWHFHHWICERVLLNTPLESRVISEDFQLTLRRDVIRIRGRRNHFWKRLCTFGNRCDDSSMDG